MKALLYVLIATILWGINFNIAKVMLQEASFLEVGLWRYVFALAILLLINAQNFPKLRSFLLAWKGLLLVGLIGLFGFNFFFFLGMITTSPINAALIISLNPATTVLCSYAILKTPITKQQLFGFAISVAGVLILLLKGQFTSLSDLELSIGDLYIFFANILFALHHVWVKKHAHELPNRHFTLFSNALCLISFLILLSFYNGAPTIQIDHDMGFWLSAFGIGSIGTGLAYLLWNSGVTEMGADKAGIFMSIVPLSTGLTAVFFNQTINSFHYVSGAVIILGMFISHISNKKKATL